MSQTELHPSYLQVAKTIVDGDHSPGTLFTHEWLREGLHIRQLQDDEQSTVAEIRALDLQYLTAIDGLKAVLLEEHNIALRCVIGKGYEVLAPRDQVDVGANILETGVRKAIRKASATLTYCDVSGLSVNERSRQLDALAKAGALHAMSKRSPLLSGRPARALAAPEPSDEDSDG